MNTSLKNILVGVVCLGLGIVAGYFMFHNEHLVGGVATANVPGTTNATPRVAQVVANMVASTTVATFYNSDTSDRVITAIDVFSTGYGATSSIANIGFGTSTSISSSTSPTGLACPAGFTGTLVASTTFATTTDPVYFTISNATTTTQSGQITPITSNPARIWATGSCLEAVTNATSTGYMNIRISYLPE